MCGHFGISPSLPHTVKLPCLSLMPHRTFVPILITHLDSLAIDINVLPTNRSIYGRMAFDNRRRYNICFGPFFPAKTTYFLTKFKLTDKELLCYNNCLHSMSSCFVLKICAVRSLWQSAAAATAATKQTLGDDDIKGTVKLKNLTNLTNFLPCLIFANFTKCNRYGVIV